MNEFRSLMFWQFFMDAYLGITIQKCNIKKIYKKRWHLSFVSDNLGENIISIFHNAFVINQVASDKVLKSAVKKRVLNKGEGRHLPSLPFLRAASQSELEYSG